MLNKLDGHDFEGEGRVGGLKIKNWKSFLCVWHFNQTFLPICVCKIFLHHTHTHTHMLSLHRTHLINCERWPDDQDDNLWQNKKRFFFVFLTSVQAKQKLRVFAVQNAVQNWQSWFNCGRCLWSWFVRCTNTTTTTTTTTAFWVYFSAKQQNTHKICAWLQTTNGLVYGTRSSFGKREREREREQLAQQTCAIIKVFWLRK